MFYISTESTLTVEKSSIQNCSSQKSGGVLFCLTSSSKFSDCTINNVSTTKEGGFALINQDSVLEILSGTSMSTV